MFYLLLYFQGGLESCMDEDLDVVGNCNEQGRTNLTGTFCLIILYQFLKTGYPFHHKTGNYLCFIECSSLVCLNILNLLHLFSFLLGISPTMCLFIPHVSFSLSLFTYFVHFFFLSLSFMSLLLSNIYFDFWRFWVLELTFKKVFGVIFFSHPRFPWHTFSTQYVFLLPHHISFDPVSLLLVLSFTDAIKNSLTLRINVCLYCCLQSNSSDVYSPSGFCLACFFLLSL